YVRPETLRKDAGRFAPLAVDRRVRCLRGVDASGRPDEGCTQAGLPDQPAPCPFGGTPETRCLTGLAHISLPVSPANAHYGAKGDYRTCLGNLKVSPERFRACQDGSARPLILGEPGRDGYTADGPVKARLSYNPLFDALIEDVRGVAGAR
ncbi:MAG: alpha/beta hydrolase, partial [Ignavibacteriales bacterium]